MKVIYQEICYSNSTNTPFVPTNPHITKKTDSEAFIFVCAAKANHDRVLYLSGVWDRFLLYMYWDLLQNEYVK